MSLPIGSFSDDRLRWWTGTAWMPTRPPDGRSASWTGSEWAARGGAFGTGALLAIALALGAVEFLWAFIVLTLITSEVNAEWVASGRVAYESITEWPLSTPLLYSLLIVPTIASILAAANLRRYWWIGVLVLGGWPLVLLAVFALSSPGDQSGNLKYDGVIIAALIAIGWVVHLFVWRSWKLSADGKRWVRGSRSYPTLSSDGLWRWDGRTWQPVLPT
jgi:hypothetical protein